MDSMKISLGRAAALVIALSCAAAPASFAQDPAVAQQTINVMHKLWGEHPGFRANHAKGVVVEGTFTATGAGAKLSKAPLFQGQPIPVTARFSDATGLPEIPDGSPDANPHGAAFKFHLAGGGEMDLVLNSLSFFPVATGAEFRDLLQAVAASGPGSPKPTALDRFFDSHPAAPRAFATAATPESFARETYNGLDAFIFVDGAGKRQPFRWRVVPVSGTEHLSAADAAKQPPNFLVDELPARLAKQQVQFRLLAQLAKPGDPTNDATRPWPEDRDLVDLGTITLRKAAPDSAAAAKQLLFMPNNLSDGIEASDDPLIDARVLAYAISFSLRSQH